jgi:hypothetical protein
VGPGPRREGPGPPATRSGPAAQGASGVLLMIVNLSGM